MASLTVLADRARLALGQRALTLATAESCTGGLLGHVLTEIAGISQQYLGGVISYSDRAKRELLGVPARLIEDHGAVSAQVCVAMADGARERFGSSLAVAITGIAGPDGGTNSKPVGLTYVAIVDDARRDVRRFAWHGDRAANKLASAQACLELLLERLEHA